MQNSPPGGAGTANRRRFNSRSKALCTTQGIPKTGEPEQHRATPVTNRFFIQFIALIARCSLAALLCLNVAHAAKLVVNGVPEELAENVRLVAGALPKDDALIDLYVELLPSQARKALAAYGYYEPEVQIQRNVVDGEQIIVVNIDAGSPILIDSINVKVTGPGETDTAFQEIRRRIPMSKGAIFLSSEYEATKSLLLDAAQAKGYFDFKFVTNTVLVSRGARTAIVNLVADSGPRFTFGQIRFDQNIFSDTFLNRWVPFSPNDPYDAAKIAEFTQNLQSSGYFSNVRVSPQRDVRYGPTVPILVSLTRKDANQVGIGIGYEDDVGVRGKLTWGKPLINRHGHSADVELSLSKVSQALTFAYRIPRRNQPLNNYWGFETGVRRAEDNEGVKSLLSTVNFQRARRLGNQWNESVFIRWERERYTIAGEDDVTNLVLPGISYSRTRSKGFPFLTWGQSSSFQFLYGNRELLSTIDFYKAVVNFKYLRAVTDRNTFIFALKYGAITTNDFDRVPASQRFFAGGDRSIRGYDFRSVSPRNLEGELKGGRYLEAGTLEYNYRFADRWSFAVFADIGRAFNNFSTSQKIGAGIGVRWQSPVGPFRLDLARPVNDDENDKILVHISLGPDL